MSRYRLRIELEPCPCPRPRVSKWGTYYPKRYTAWKKAMAAALTAAAEQGSGLIDGPLAVRIKVVATRPKTSKLPFPKPDVDNYAKAVLDAMSRILCVDDWLIARLTVTKRWTLPGETAHIDLSVSRLTT